MDFWRTVMVLFRRWYITVPAFLATVGLATAAYSVVPVQYQSGSILVLTTPLSGGTQSTQPNHPNPVTNPLMNFDQSLALTASIVIQQLSSSETARALGIAPAGTTNFTVNNGSANPELLESGPFIFVTGTGSSPAEAQDITEEVSAMAARVLAERQKALKAPDSTHIELQVVVAPTAGQPLTGSPLRAAAAVGALAAVMSLVAAYGFESMTAHRRRRVNKRREQSEPEAADMTDPSPDRGGGIIPVAESVESLDLVHADSGSGSGSENR